MNVLEGGRNFISQLNIWLEVEGYKWAGQPLSRIPAIPADVEGERG